jgi:hypothetical protein
LTRNTSCDDFALWYGRATETVDGKKLNFGNCNGLKGSQGSLEKDDDCSCACHNSAFASSSTTPTINSCVTCSSFCSSKVEHHAKEIEFNIMVDKTSNTLRKERKKKFINRRVSPEANAKFFGFYGHTDYAAKKNTYKVDKDFSGDDSGNLVNNNVDRMEPPLYPKEIKETSNKKEPEKPLGSHLKEEEAGVIVPRHRKTRSLNRFTVEEIVLPLADIKEKKN